MASDTALEVRIVSKSFEPTLTLSPVKSKTLTVNITSTTATPMITRQRPILAMSRAMLSSMRLTHASSALAAPFSRGRFLPKMNRTNSAVP